MWPWHKWFTSIKKGYHVTFCDISDSALKKVKQKIKFNKINKNYKIVNLSKNENYFLNKKSLFDYVICFSVFNNLGTKDNAIKYIKLFNKILKKEGKLIIDSNLEGKNNYKLIDKKKVFILLIQTMIMDFKCFSKYKEFYKDNKDK